MTSLSDHTGNVLVQEAQEPVKECVCYIDACPAMGKGDGCCGGKVCGCGKPKES